MKPNKGESEVIPVEKRESDNKVKALKDRIVEECRRQGFTLDEYVRLVDCLRYVYEHKKKEIYKAAML